MNDIKFDQELDCMGMNCPLPIVKTNKTIAAMDSGQILKVKASDPGSVNDMTAWSKQTENKLLAHTLDGDIYTYFIQKA